MVCESSDESSMSMGPSSNSDGSENDSAVIVVETELAEVRDLSSVRSMTITLSSSHSDMRGSWGVRV